MKRREFIKSSLLAAGGAYLWPPIAAHSSQTAPPPLLPADPNVKRVLTIFKCHFDAGFIDTQAAVVNRYFSEYFPRAISVANEVRLAGNYRYVWTTGSWLLYEYLEQASPDERRRMETAISAGDIAWHALPFNWQTEMLDRSMITGAIALSQSLDRRFGCTTTGAKMTDVPGHTRGLIAPLAAQGVKFLDIGVNGACPPAQTPPLFVWTDPGGASLIVFYHHAYGSITRVPGTDLAIAISMLGDNKGPHNPDQIAKVYADLSAQFPNAQIIATNLSAIANSIEPYRANLPIFTQEIGDTWIYGVASDPVKVARYREIARLRGSWLAQGKFQIGDAVDLGLLRRLLLEPEHTWGTDTKTWLDFDHYTPHDLAEMLNTKNYKVTEFSWNEKRQDLFQGISSLPAPLREQALTAVHSLTPKQPQLLHASPLAAGQDVETAHFIVRLDSNTGAIVGLRNKASKREWASADHTLAALSYQTLSHDDYTKFLSTYLINATDWAMKDFGKPNIEHFGAQSQDWVASLAELHAEENQSGHRLLARLEIRDQQALQSGRAAFPQKMYMELDFPVAEPIVNLNLYWFGKPATRLPEALWLTFNPLVPSQRGWVLDKSGQEISPFDVAVAGGRSMHAVTTGFSYLDENESFTVETLDAPLIALGEKSPLNFSKAQPDLSGGIHCNLFNNGWGTNYIMWFGEDMRFRFVLRP